MSSIMEVITGRRSIRRYTPPPVPGEMLRDVLTAAQWAPSWANTQCWETRSPSGSARAENPRGFRPPGPLLT